jgi:glycogen operon protein
MSPQDWSVSFARAVTMALSGATGDETRPDDPFLLMLNAWWEPLEFQIPEPLRDLAWATEVDTFDPHAAGRAVARSAGVRLNGRSLLLLRGTPS